MTLENRLFFKTIALGAFVVLLIGASTFLQPSSACAAGSPTSCDPEYMDALEARAMMEAQREISMNKNLIFKPDSVLEYTCFGSYLSHLAGAAGFFSENGCCGTTGLGGGSLDAALQNAVGSALMTYLNNNFPNQFLNGRATFAKTVFGGVTSGTYACNMMQQVWNDAKCMDFAEQNNHDSFYDFNWYINNDPRPRNLSAAWSGGVAGNNCASPLTTADYDVAYNNQSARYLLPAENPWSDANPANDFAPYIEDPVNSYFQLILPLGDVIPSTGATVTCETPILTGVCVNRGPSTSPYPDGVCPNPGCHYQPPGGATTCASTPSASWCVGP